jgi:hypothetical protein
MDALRQKVALRIARRLLVVVAPCLREEEWGDFVEECQVVVAGELQRFEAKVKTVRLEPGQN